MNHRLDRIDEALRLLAEAVQSAEEDIDIAIEAWETLQTTYGEEYTAANNPQSFTSWGLTSIDASLINRVGEWIHGAQFNSLATEKKAALRNIARAFKTEIWMIYFVLGESLIANTLKSLKLILRIKRLSSSLTLERLLTSLEEERFKRRGVRLRNVSNDMTKFTFYDVKNSVPALCPMLLSPPASVDGSVPQNPTTPDRDSASALSPPQTHIRTPPAAPKKPDKHREDIPPIAILYNTAKLASHLSSPPQTPPDTYYDTDSELEIEQPRGCSPPLNDIAFGSDDINTHEIGFQSHFIEEDIESSPIYKTAYMPGNLDTIEDRSVEYNVSISEADDAGSFDYPDQLSNSDFEMEVLEKRSHQLARQWGKPGKLLLYQRTAILEPRHLCELDDGHKLTDETVNYYMKYLVGSSPIASKIFTQPSFFYTNLQRSFSERINYRSVSSWPEKQGGVSLNDADYLLLPIYDHAAKHWFLIVAGSLVPGQRLLAGTRAGEDKRATAFITTIDSLGSRPENEHAANVVRSYICQEASVKFGIELDQSHIEIKPPRQVLLQENDTDCGLYVLEHTRRLVADPSAFIDRIFQGRLVTVFDVATMRAQIGNVIIQDKLEQDCDGNRDSGIQRDAIDEVVGIASEADDVEFISNNNTDFDAGTAGVEHDLNAELTPHEDVDGQMRKTKHSPVKPGTQEGVGAKLQAEDGLDNFGESNSQQHISTNQPVQQNSESRTETARSLDFEKNRENLNAELFIKREPQAKGINIPWGQHREFSISNDEDLQSHPNPPPKSPPQSIQLASPRVLFRVRDKSVPIHVEPLSLDRDNAMDRGLQSKRQRITTYSPENTLITLSPSMIIQMIAEKEKLTQLSPFPQLSDLEQCDLVDSKTWQLLQNSIDMPKIGSDLAIKSVSIVRHLGFPCISSLPEAFNLHCSSDEKQEDCNVQTYLFDAYRRCLLDYAAAAGQASTSAQVLRELIRLTRNTIKSIQVEYGQDIKHLKEFVTPFSTFRDQILANAQKEITVLLQCLETLFQRSQTMVSELNKYRLQVQDAQMSAASSV